MFHVIIAALAIIIMIRTLSFAIWTFRTRNIAGGIMLCVIAIFCLSPIFILMK